MSRPRKPFGAQQPGRLPSTMMKVLAAEMSDPQRLRRGKQYAKDGSVLDIIVEPGVVTCEVQGSRSTPYIASLEVSMGNGMPLRRDVHAVCNCPDDDNWSNHACKHVLATMFTFADELLMEPELLDVWRGNETADAVDRGDTDGRDDTDGRSTRRSTVSGFDPDDPTDDDDSDSIPGRRRHLQLVRDGMEQGRAERRLQAAERTRDPIADPLADVLSIPEGATLPEIPHLERAEERLPRRPELASILRDAYRSLRIDWD
ncbi:MAG: hypothetical protein ABJH68_02380 [Ilumatobacter sp.]|uniref:hypothetical protein n=1 Tax=Ilumatobacter sp. TaxID=1967498 RepID=UPI0032986B3D